MGPRKTHSSDGTAYEVEGGTLPEVGVYVVDEDGCPDIEMTQEEDEEDDE